MKMKLFKIDQTRKPDEIEFVKFAKPAGRVADASRKHILGEPIETIVPCPKENQLDIWTLWKRLPAGMSMDCHIPVYGLLFKKDQHIFLEASVCWECNNIRILADGKPDFYWFDSKAKDSQQLLLLIKRAFGA